MSVAGFAHFQCHLAFHKYKFAPINFATKSVDAQGFSSFRSVCCGTAVAVAKYQMLPSFIVEFYSL